MMSQGPPQNGGFRNPPFDGPGKPGGFVQPGTPSFSQAQYSNGPAQNDMANGQNNMYVQPSGQQRSFQQSPLKGPPQMQQPPQHMQGQEQQQYQKQQQQQQQQMSQQFSNMQVGGRPPVPQQQQLQQGWSQGPPQQGMHATPSTYPSGLSGPPSHQPGPPPQQGMPHSGPGQPGVPPVSMGMPPLSGPNYPPQSNAPMSMSGPQVNMSGPPVGVRGPGVQVGISSSNTQLPGTGYPGMPQTSVPGMPPSSMSGPMSMSGPTSAMGAPMPGHHAGRYPQQTVMHQPGVQGGYPPSSMSGMPQQPIRPPNSGMGHPAPMSPVQQQRRIDPDQMPSPIQVMKDDMENWINQPFNTSVRGRVPPLVTSSFLVRDDGNANPRFIRSTMYNVPCNSDLLKACNIPFAVVAAPLANIPPTEAPLMTVDHGTNGPVRCNRCKAYMNPFVQFIDGGRKFVCNFCSYSTEVPADYFCHLDHQGQRVDAAQRAELCCGSYEFTATLDYCKNQKPPQPPAFIFMIDVSYQSIQSGMVRLLMREMKNILKCLPKESGEEESKVRVGFVTYSNVLHFYNIKENLALPQMMVVSDVSDVFVPLQDGFLVSPIQAENVIDSLLEQITSMFADTRDTEVVLGPVVQAALEALKSAGCSGKAFIFHSSLPVTEAPGKLKNREDRNILGSDKEKTVLTPQTSFYKDLAKDCVEGGLSVDLFLFPNAYVDVATIGCLATITGGQIYRYSYFKESTHGTQFIEDLSRNIKRNTGFEAIMRLRCSTGLRPVDFFGNFYMSNSTDVELASIDCDKAIAIEIKHDDKLPENSTAYIQAALLYTSVSGQRRLRIHNLAFSTCTQLADLFRCCEMDTYVNFVSKQALKAILNTPPKTVKETLMNQCASVLACYRRNCAAPSSAGQLILPECMKLLPLYTNCIIKSDALAGGAEMSPDDRSWLMASIQSMDQAATVPYFYPRLLPIHDVDVEDSSLPKPIRCSIDRMLDSGVYLLENGISLFMWIGLQVDHQWLHDVFEVSTIGHVDIEMTSLPALDNPLSLRIRNIILEIQSQRQRYLKLTIVRQRDKLEPWLKHYLVEDKGMNPATYTYVDFLCFMHKEIRNLLQ